MTPTAEIPIRPMQITNGASEGPVGVSPAESPDPSVEKLSRPAPYVRCGHMAGHLATALAAPALGRLEPAAVAVVRRAAVRLGIGGPHKAEDETAHASEPEKEDPRADRRQRHAYRQVSFQFPVETVHAPKKETGDPTLPQNIIFRP